MSPKSLALLIAGIVIISGLFTVFHVAYPSGNPIIEKIPQNLPNVTIFEQQFPDHNLLGMGNTTFHSSGNQTVIIEGYVTNATSGKDIPNSLLYSAMFPEETSTDTNSTGFYQIALVHSGEGTFAFKISGYKTDYVNLEVYGITNYWLNLSFTPSVKYEVSGYTVTQNDTVVPNVGIQLTGFFNSYSGSSDSNGFFSLNLPNDTYKITVNKAGFEKTTNPELITVAGKPQSNLKIELTNSQKPLFNVSGYILNDLKAGISGATVISYPEMNNVSSSSTGYYSVPVGYGQTVIYAAAVGYGMNSTGPIYVISNMTGVNITLSSQNPFSGTGASSGQGLGGMGGGSSGVGANGGSGSEAGNLSNYLNNNTSNVTYGNSSSGSGTPLILRGYITNANDSGPVFDTYLRFYIDVNGTYFYENVTTNSTGFYQFYVSSPGNYKIAVYSPIYQLYSFGVWINSTGKYHNFTLTPLSKYIFKVSGYIRNAIDNQLISGSEVVAGVPPYNILVNYSFAENGFYTMYLTEGNYSLTGNAAGYLPNSVETDLTNNTWVNISLTPSSSIGSNVGQWSSSNGTGIPGVGGSSVYSNLTSGGFGNGSATGAKTLSLNIHLDNASDSAPIANTQFVLFIRLDSQSYKWSNSTDSNGNSTVVLYYTGNYTFLATSLLFEGSPVTMNVSGNTSVTFNMTPRTVYGVTITLKNAYGTYSGTNLPVPQDYLNVTNYYLSIEPTGVSATNDGTVFTYLLPNASYDFSYTNTGFVNNQTVANVSGGAVNQEMSVSPYLIIIHGNSVVSWNYSISNLVPNKVPVTASSGYEDIVNASLGSYEFSAFINGYSSSVEQRSISLKTTASVANIFFNTTKGSSNASILNIYPDPTNSSLPITNFTYSGTQNFYLYELNTNGTISGISSLSINSKGYSFTSAGDLISLSSDFQYTGSGLTVQLISQKLVYPPELILYYYVANMNSNSFSVGGV